MQSHTLYVINISMRKYDKIICMMCKNVWKVCIHDSIVGCTTRPSSAVTFFSCGDVTLLYCSVLYVFQNKYSL
ncbi:GSCOCG00000760001-RA-CDS [Cotesia congregata]|nr:GSCOCG00000760001-RA-CDS [Cotesia congregata]